jgi:hypothetical protein
MVSSHGMLTHEVVTRVTHVQKPFLISLYRTVEEGNVEPADARRMLELSFNSVVYLISVSID